MNRKLTSATIQRLICGCVITIVLLAFPLACGTGQKCRRGLESPVHHLVVLHTNDTHGHPVKFFDRGMPDVGGLPARATLINTIRKENDHVLVVDAGDLNTGEAESNLFKA